MGWGDVRLAATESLGLPARGDDSNVGPAIQTDGVAVSDGAVGRRSRLALIALAFSALTSVFGFSLITLPSESVAMLRGADLMILVALVALPLYLAGVTAWQGAQATIVRFTTRTDSEHEQAILRVDL